MSTLDEIASRDAEWTAQEIALPRYLIAADRRYLLGLVREARAGLTQLIEVNETTCFQLRRLGREQTANYLATQIDDARSVLVRLTEGSDRT